MIHSSAAVSFILPQLNYHLQVVREGLVEKGGQKNVNRQTCRAQHAPENYPLPASRIAIPVFPPHFFPRPATSIPEFFGDSSQFGNLRLRLCISRHLQQRFGFLRLSTTIYANRKRSGTKISNLDSFHPLKKRGSIQKDAKKPYPPIQNTSVKKNTHFSITSDHDPTPDIQTISSSCWWWWWWKALTKNPIDSLSPRLTSTNISHIEQILNHLKTAGRC